MLLFEKALEIVTDAVKPRREVEQIELTSSLNRVLAEDILSDTDMPPFDKSAVDGYACRLHDLFNELKVIEVIPAGKMPEKEIKANQCSKIMTGAPVPVGADAIMMVEDIEQVSEDKIKYIRQTIKNNIALKGEDIKKGEIVIPTGTVIKPQHIAVMATVGCTMPLVYHKIKVAVISTGDELVEPQVKPGLSQIRNSNAYQLMAQILQVGAEFHYIGIASDSEESLRACIDKAFDQADIILLTGGVSMGDFDYVPQLLDELKVDIKFKSIAVQPGRPTLFGTKGNQFIFGLPGNPVSSFVQFELLVKPLIIKLSGGEQQPVNVKLKIGTDFTRKRSDRLSLVPSKINQSGEVEPLEYHGSAHINALTLAHGLMFIPIGITQIKKGELVNVRLI